jgi:uncharacterized protein (TIGR00290 family)
VSARRTLLSWSSGKDSAWSLHVLRSDPRFEVVGLLTTLNESAERVSMHAVRERLLEDQAEAAGLPLQKVQLPWPCSNEDYEARMNAALAEVREQGIEVVAFGDLFLEDVRNYREERMADTGLEVHFPLWGKKTPQLAREMVAAGLRARLTCVDPRQIDRAFCGRAFDADLLDALPPSADPCGENGEFHTFAWSGPMFAHDVRITGGDTIERDGFVYTDLLPLAE